MLYNPSETVHLLYFVLAVTESDFIRAALKLHYVALLILCRSFLNVLLLMLMLEFVFVTKYRSDNLFL